MLFFNISGDEVTSDDITIATIFSHSIFSHNDRHQGHHFLKTINTFDIGGQAGAN